MTILFDSITRIISITWSAVVQPYILIWTILIIIFGIGVFLKFKYRV